jgi:hypothetical protein
MIRGKFGNTFTASYSESWGSNRIQNLAFSKRCMSSHSRGQDIGAGSKSLSWTDGRPACESWRNRWNGTEYRPSRVSW